MEITLLSCISVAFEITHIENIGCPHSVSFRTLTKGVAEIPIFKEDFLVTVKQPVPSILFICKHRLKKKLGVTSSCPKKASSSLRALFPDLSNGNKT